MPKVQDTGCALKPVDNLPQYVVVSALAGVNLRLTSSKDGEICGTIPNNSILRVIGRERDENGNARLLVVGYVAEWLTRHV